MTLQWTYYTNTRLTDIKIQLSRQAVPNVFPLRKYWPCMCRTDSRFSPSLLLSPCQPHIFSFLPLAVFIQKLSVLQQSVILPSQLQYLCSYMPPSWNVGTTNSPWYIKEPSHNKGNPFLAEYFVHYRNLMHIGMHSCIEMIFKESWLLGQISDTLKIYFLTYDA
jgi:hypothetical protein